MNILLVSGPGINLKEPYDSGIESFIVSLANELINRGHNVDVVAEIAEPTAKFTVIDPFVKSKKIANKWLRKRQEQAEFASLDTASYDIVHYNMFYPHLIKTGRKFHKPSLLSLHSPVDRRRLKVYKKLPRHMDMAFVAVSDRIQEQWDAVLPVETTLIYNGIDMKRWKVKKALGGDHLLWSGRINDSKNPLAAILLAQHLNRKLIIAGKITDKDYFESTVKPYLNEQIVYVGHKTQEDLNKLAQNATAYLATATWQEPFGLASLEMLASGVPVVGFKTAIPPLWNNQCINTTSSANWGDLLSPLRASEFVTPTQCRDFASTMSIETMANDYIALYRLKAISSVEANDYSYNSLPINNEGVSHAFGTSRGSE
jgi:glycosyltransferase involved in cell wall biosynthesis